jgi:hypothetical protein
MAPLSPDETTDIRDKLEEMRNLPWWAPLLGVWPVAVLALLAVTAFIAVMLAIT